MLDIASPKDQTLVDRDFRRPAMESFVEGSETFVQIDFGTVVSDAWRRVDSTLSLWSQSPSALADEGYLAPTLETINRAQAVLAKLRDFGHRIVAPSRVVTTPEGGICIEFGRGEYMLYVEVFPDGTGEIRAFQNDAEISVDPIPRIRVPASSVR